MSHSGFGGWVRAEGVLAVALGSSLALATDFSWIAGEPDDDWDTCANWVASGLASPCYPDDAGDNAEIAYSGSTWTVNLINESIGRLTIGGNVDFGSAGGTPALEVDVVVVDASNGDVTLTISGATLTNAPT
ncbi:MAG: hypothetical protein CHACPFDD_00944 [Phycisphaerae bacterium]|nr:hypothetical protein [Phycisphaerae bacterium]